MAVTAPRGWLVTYDITDPRRLARLHRFLCQHATPVQYSVFHYEGSSLQLRGLLAEVAHRIDPRTDDVRAYPLPHELSLDTLGKGHFPVDTMLLSTHSPSLQKLLAIASPRRWQDDGPPTAEQARPAPAR